MSEGKSRPPTKPEDWMEAAERVGNQLARGIDAFGDRVQKAIESLDNAQRPRRRGIKVEDHRDDPDGVPVESLAKGDVFDLNGDLFMRLGAIPDARRKDELDAVDLASGDVRQLERGTKVIAVDAKVVVEARRSTP